MSDCSRCDDLMQENDLLRHKLSPLQDKKLTAELALAMAKVDFSEYKRELKRGTYIVVTPQLVSALAFGNPEPTSRQSAAIGRSLQALLWERSALSGDLVYVMPIEEYEEIKP